MGIAAVLLYFLAYHYHLERNKRIEQEDQHFKEVNDNLEYIKISGAEKQEFRKNNNLLKSNLKKNNSFVLLV